MVIPNEPREVTEKTLEIVSEIISNLEYVIDQIELSVTPVTKNDVLAVAYSLRDFFELTRKVEEYYDE